MIPRLTWAQRKAIARREAIEAQSFAQTIRTPGPLRDRDDESPAARLRREQSNREREGLS